MALDVTPQLHRRPFGGWSANMAYALGLFYADGSISRPSRSWYVQFYNTDLATVEWWHKFVEGTNPVHVRDNDRDNPLYSSRVTDDALGERLIRLGARPRKSVEDHPWPLMDDQFEPHFIRGFFDGDGGVWIGSAKKMKGGKILKVSLTCNAPTFRRDLKNRVQRVVGKAGTVSETTIHLRLSGAAAEQFLAWLYGHEGPHMARKKAEWKKWCQFRKEHGGLIMDTDPYESLRGLREEPWHSLCYTHPVSEVVRRVRVSRSRVYQVRKALGIKEVRCGA